MQPGRYGRIIFLNGVSSSGKSTIAQELLRQLDTPFFAMSVDDINALRAKQRTLELGADELAQVLFRTRAGFHRAVAGMAHAGNDLVVDHVLSEHWRLIDCLAVLDGLDVTFVGVHCELGELRRREMTRGDREAGHAERQLAQVHAHGVYDIEFDTAHQSARDCAQQIKAYVSQPGRGRAFDELRTIALANGELDPEPDVVSRMSARGR